MWQLAGELACGCSLCCPAGFYLDEDKDTHLKTAVLIPGAGWSPGHKNSIEVGQMLDELIEEGIVATYEYNDWNQGSYKTFFSSKHF